MNFGRVPLGLTGVVATRLNGLVAENALVQAVQDRVGAVVDNAAQVILRGGAGAQEALDDMHVYVDSQVREYKRYKPSRKNKELLVITPARGYTFNRSKHVRRRKFKHYRKW